MQDQDGTKVEWLTISHDDSTESSSYHINRIQFDEWLRSLFDFTPNAHLHPSSRDLIDVIGTIMPLEIWITLFEFYITSTPVSTPPENPYSLTKKDIIDVFTPIIAGSLSFMVHSLITSEIPIYFKYSTLKATITPFPADFQIHSSTVSAIQALLTVFYRYTSPPNQTISALLVNSAFEESTALKSRADFKYIQHCKAIAERMFLFLLIVMERLILWRYYSLSLTNRQGSWHSSHTHHLVMIINDIYAVFQAQLTPLLFICLFYLPRHSHTFIYDEIPTPYALPSTTDTLLSDQPLHLTLEQIYNYRTSSFRNYLDSSDANTAPGGNESIGITPELIPASPILHLLSTLLIKQIAMFISICFDEIMKQYFMLFPPQAQWATSGKKDNSIDDTNKDETKEHDTDSCPNDTSPYACIYETIFHICHSTFTKSEEKQDVCDITMDIDGSSTTQCTTQNTQLSYIDCLSHVQMLCTDLVIYLYYYVMAPNIGTLYPVSPAHHSSTSLHDDHSNASFSSSAFHDAIRPSYLRQQMALPLELFPSFVPPNTLMTKYSLLSPPLAPYLFPYLYIDATNANPSGYSLLSDEKYTTYAFNANHATKNGFSGATSIRVVFINLLRALVNITHPSFIVQLSALVHSPNPSSGDKLLFTQRTRTAQDIYFECGTVDNTRVEQDPPLTQATVMVCSANQYGDLSALFINDRKITRNTQPNTVTPLDLTSPSQEEVLHPVHIGSDITDAFSNSPCLFNVYGNLINYACDIILASPLTANQQQYMCGKITNNVLYTSDGSSSVKPSNSKASLFMTPQTSSSVWAFLLATYLQPLVMLLKNADKQPCRLLGVSMAHSLLKLFSYMLPENPSYVSHADEIQTFLWEYYAHSSFSRHSSQHIDRTFQSECINPQYQYSLLPAFRDVILQAASAQSLSTQDKDAPTVSSTANTQNPHIHRRMLIFPLLEALPQVISNMDLAPLILSLLPPLVSIKSPSISYYFSLHIMVAMCRLITKPSIVPSIMSAQQHSTPSSESGTPSNTAIRSLVQADEQSTLVITSSTSIDSIYTATPAQKNADHQWDATLRLFLDQYKSLNSGEDEDNHHNIAKFDLFMKLYSARMESTNQSDSIPYALDQLHEREQMQSCESTSYLLPICQAKKQFNPTSLKLFTACQLGRGSLLHNKLDEQTDTENGDGTLLSFTVDDHLTYLFIDHLQYHYQSPEYQQFMSMYNPLVDTSKQRPITGVAARIAAFTRLDYTTSFKPSTKEMCSSLFRDDYTLFSTSQTQLVFNDTIFGLYTAPPNSQSCRHQRSDEHEQITDHTSVSPLSNHTNTIRVFPPNQPTPKIYPLVGSPHHHHLYVLFCHLQLVRIVPIKQLVAHFSSFISPLFTTLGQEHTPVSIKVVACTVLMATLNRLTYSIPSSSDAINTQQQFDESEETQQQHPSGQQKISGTQDLHASTRYIAHPALSTRLLDIVELMIPTVFDSMIGSFQLIHLLYDHFIQIHAAKDNHHENNSGYEATLPISSLEITPSRTTTTTAIQRNATYTLLSTLFSRDAPLLDLPNQNNQISLTVLGTSTHPTPLLLSSAAFNYRLHGWNGEGMIFDIDNINAHVTGKSNVSRDHDKNRSTVTLSVVDDSDHSDAEQGHIDHIDQSHVTVSDTPITETHPKTSAHHVDADAASRSTTHEMLSLRYDFQVAQQSIPFQSFVSGEDNNHGNNNGNNSRGIHPDSRIMEDMLLSEHMALYTMGLSTLIHAYHISTSFHPLHWLSAFTQTNNRRHMMPSGELLPFLQSFCEGDWPSDIFTDQCCHLPKIVLKHTTTQSHPHPHQEVPHTEDLIQEEFFTLDTFFDQLHASPLRFMNTNADGDNDTTSTIHHMTPVIAFVSPCATHRDHPSSTASSTDPIDNPSSNHPQQTKPSPTIEISIDSSPFAFSPSEVVDVIPEAVEPLLMIMWSCGMF